MVNIVTFNCNGLGDVKKWSKVFNFLHGKPYDIICLQEVHCDKSKVKMFKSHWGGHFFASCGTSNAKGCAILVRKKLNINVKCVKCDSFGRLVILALSVKEYDLILCNVYAPQRG